MKIALIGGGNGGSKVVDTCLNVEQQIGRDYIRHATVINSATADFEVLDHLDRHQQVLIGQHKTKGHGTGADNRLGAKIAKANINQIQRAIGDISVHEIDAFVVCAALGGGTGSGAAPVIIRQLQESYDEPVYSLAILPSMREGGRAQMNTARSFQSLVDVADNVLVFDNDVWLRSGETATGAYERLNREIARRFTVIFAAGEVDGSAAAENVVDSSEIIKTLACGGISAIGYSSEDVEPAGEKGLLGRLRNGDDATGEMQRTETKVLGLIRQAVSGQLTVPCDHASTRQALAVVSGPRDELSQAGIESARTWIEEECDTPDVRAGDDPRTQSSLIGAVLLSGLTECRRVEEIQQKGVNAQADIEAQDERHDEATEELATTDELDGLL